MPYKLPVYVERFRDRHGKLRFYFRRGKGRRQPLPSDPSSDEFHAAWLACFEGLTAAPKPSDKRERELGGSIGALITSYRQSSAFAALKLSTKRGYNSRLERLRIDHGKRSVAEMNRAAIVNKVLQPLAVKPGAAHDTLKKLRILIRHAIDIGWLSHDPSVGIRRAKLKEIRSWSDQEIATFEAKWPVGTPQRLAFALHLYTGQRVSDVRRMTWADIQGGVIRVNQQKTGAKLTVPVHEKLVPILNQTRRRHALLLTTAFEKPFSEKGYGQWLRTAITKASLPLECQPHGLRKAAGRRLAEAGCSTREIMSVLGHRSITEAERYTRDADQAHLAASAFARLEHESRTTIPKPIVVGLGKPRESQVKNKMLAQNMALPRGIEPLFSP